jgi:hypothetical protein
MTHLVIKYEQKGREAFWGNDKFEILLKEFPNGCTLQESIDYFKQHGEELEALGLL